MGRYVHFIWTVELLAFFSAVHARSDRTIMIGDEAATQPVAAGEWVFVLFQFQFHAGRGRTSNTHTRRVRTRPLPPSCYLLFATSLSAYQKHNMGFADLTYGRVRHYMGCVRVNEVFPTVVRAGRLVQGPSCDRSSRFNRSARLINVRRCRVWVTVHQCMADRLIVRVGSMRWSVHIHMRLLLLALTVL